MSIATMCRPLSFTIVLLGLSSLLVLGDKNSSEILHDVAPTEISVVEALLCETRIETTTKIAVIDTDNTQSGQGQSTEIADVDYEIVPSESSPQDSYQQCAQFANESNSFSSTTPEPDNPSISNQGWEKEAEIVREPTHFLSKFAEPELVFEIIYDPESTVDVNVFCGLYCNIDIDSDYVEQTLEIFIPPLKVINEENFRETCSYLFEDVFQLFENLSNITWGRDRNQNWTKISMDFLRAGTDLKHDFNKMTQLRGTESDFTNNQTMFFNNIKLLETNFIQLRNNKPEYVEEQLNSLIMGVLNLQLDSKICILHSVSERNIFTKGQLHSCVNEILSEHKYQDCDSLLDFVTNKIQTLRTVIQLTYAKGAQNVGHIITYVARLNSFTFQIVCYEALIDSMLNANNILDVQVLLIYDKLIQMRDNSSFELSSTSTDFKAQGKMLANLLQSPINVIINSWVVDIKGNQFGNISFFVSGCLHCLDRPLVTKENILERITKLVFERNPQRIELILKFYGIFKSSKHGIEIMETLVKEITHVHNLQTPKIFLIEHELRDSGFYLANQTRFRLTNIKYLHSPFIKSQLREWAYLIITNDFTQINSFASQYRDQFTRTVLPDVIKTTYSHRSDSFVQILKLAAQFTNLTNSITALSTLVNYLNTKNRLNSPIVLVISNAVIELENHVQYRTQQHVKSKEGLTAILTSAVYTEINKISNTILSNTHRSIIVFSETHPKSFARIFDTLIKNAYSKSSTDHNIMSILSLCLHLPTFTHKIRCVNLVIDEMTRTGKINSLTVFIIDDVIDDLLALTSVHSYRRELSSCKSKIASVLESQSNRCANYIVSLTTDSLVAFSDQFPKAFELMIKHVIPIAYSGMSKNIYPISYFAYQSVNNVTHNSMAIIALVESVRKTYEGFSNLMVFVIHYYIDKIMSLSSFTRIVPSKIKSDLHLVKSSISDHIHRQIDKWSSSIMNGYYSPIATEYRGQYSAMLEGFLPQLVKKVYSNGIHSTMKLLDFGSALPYSRSIIVFETLVGEMKTHGHLNSHFIFVVQRKIREVSDGSESSFVQAKNIISAACDGLINVWGSKIRTDTRTHEILNVASQYKDALKPYFGQLARTALESTRSNIPPLISFLKQLNDIELVTTMCESLHGHPSSRNVLFSEESESIAFAAFVREKLESSVYDKSTWTNFKNSFPYRIQTLIFHDKLCIRNKIENEYLFGCGLKYFNSNARYAFTWRETKGVKPGYDYYWKLHTDDGYKFTIQNTYHKDYLTAETAKYDYYSRYVTSRHYKYQSSYWRLSHLYSDVYIIWNDYFSGEQLFASLTSDAFDYQRRRVLSSANILWDDDSWEITRC